VQSAKRQFIKADVNGDGKLSYAEFQHWFNTEYRKDLEDEATKHAQVYEDNVGLIEKELYVRDQAVVELQDELKRLKSQLELKGLVSSRAPAADGWLAGKDKMAGKDAPLIQIKRPRRVVLFKTAFKAMEEFVLIIFEIESSDFSLITQTPLTLRMGPVVKILVSHNTYADCNFVLTLTPLLSVRLSGANTRSLMEMPIEERQPFMQKIMESLDVHLVDNPQNTLQKELVVRFSTNEILYKVKIRQMLTNTH
jgi:hypothetical protein